jgi:hypothetical protein
VEMTAPLDATRSDAAWPRKAYTCGGVFLSEDATQPPTSATDWSAHDGGGTAQWCAANPLLWCAVQVLRGGRAPLRRGARAHGGLCTIREGHAVRCMAPPSCQCAHGTPPPPQVRTAAAGTRPSYWLFGHSAGAQFAHRCAVGRGEYVIEC